MLRMIKKMKNSKGKEKKLLTMALQLLFWKRISYRTYSVHLSSTVEHFSCHISIKKTAKYYGSGNPS